MVGFSAIEIDGYRRLQDVKLKLGPLNVLIGGNGSGKTSLLEVFSLLAASAEGQLGPSISDLGGFQSIATIGSTRSISFGISTEELDYQLRIKSSGPYYGLEFESIEARPGSQVDPFEYRNGQLWYREKDGNLTHRDAVSNLMETTLSESAKSSSREPLRRLLGSPSYYSLVSVAKRSPLRTPQQLVPAKSPGRDGETLVSCLYDLREANPDRYELIEDILRAAFPGFQKLEFPPVAAGTLAVTWKDRNFTSRSLYTNELSEGMLRFLWLVTLLHSPGLTAVTLLDEPEVSLHPELLSMLAEILREVAEEKQIIVATHSDSLVGFLKPEEVIVVDVDDKGRSHLTRADSMDLDHWLQNYRLDELWGRGLIGARQ